MGREHASSLSRAGSVFKKIVGSLTLVVSIMTMIAAASTVLSLWMGLEYDPSIYHNTLWYRVLGHDSKLFYAVRHMALSCVGVAAGWLLLKQASVGSWAMVGLFWIYGAVRALTWPNPSPQTLLYGGLLACIGLTCCLAAVTVKVSRYR